MTLATEQIIAYLAVPLFRDRWQQTLADIRGLPEFQPDKSPTEGR